MDYSNFNKFSKDYDTGFNDGAQTNPKFSLDNRTGEALLAYQQGFNQADADMSDYYDNLE